VLAPETVHPDPAAFRAASALVPDVTGASSESARQRQVPEALTEVFVDFLVRWVTTSSLRATSPQFLLELADRTARR